MLLVEPEPVGFELGKALEFEFEVPPLTETPPVLFCPPSRPEVIVPLLLVLVVVLVVVPALVESEFE